MRGDELTLEESINWKKRGGRKKSQILTNPQRKPKRENNKGVVKEFSWGFVQVWVKFKK